MSALDAALQGRKVVVCVGSGGVGKTTVSAAIALQAAMQGKKAMVCTIDPARRLANALGLLELGNVETRVSREKLEASGLAPEGELWAMMLDLRRTWDELIARHTPVEKQRAIYESRFYQQLSSALAGSQEYVAMDKLVQLYESGAYDLVVLDTPPTAHALDFLDAPNRVLDFFGDDRVRWILAPALKAGRVGLGMFNLTGGYFVRTLSRLAGLNVLEELAEFLLTLTPMYEVFKERALAVKQLLGSREAAFVLVSSPSPLTVDEALYFHRLLVQDAMPVAAVVANRVRLAPPAPQEGDIDSLVRLIEGEGGGDAHEARVQDCEHLAARVRRGLEEMRLLAQQDESEIARLAAGCAPTPVTRVPHLESEVYDLAALWELDRYLFGQAWPGQQDAGPG
jgi:anion-transporting  ArsA/GET3 family ATPase